MIKKLTLSLSTCCMIFAALVSIPITSAQETGESAATAATEPKTNDANIAEFDTAPIPASEVTEDTDIDTAAATLRQYIVQESNDQPRFNSAKAKQDNASEYLISIGDEFNKISEYHEKNSELTQELGIPIHGNWCGPGHSGPGAPIDTLDRLCQTHDRCYGNRGYFACSCDRELVQAIRTSRFSGATEKAKAVAIATYFSTAPCNPFA